ncbi:MAG TPA: adenylyltransferase/cytidyltransferase family protein [Terracidiphilus sp.]|jgi:glycerol-3-phosphate cytidylyltransferase|nr:adenylyltransferase/cytidyltransferase family protein [Terracidiphilus sp.]
MSKIVLTYGTFDLFHVGHLRLLERARALGDSLIVGVSTDEFNIVKGKKTFIEFCHRIEIVRSLRCVVAVFPETCWEQKRNDVARYKADIFTMGSDWTGKFDSLKDQCEVLYLPRTENISSTELRARLANPNAIQTQHIHGDQNLCSSPDR